MNSSSDRRPSRQNALKGLSVPTAAFSGMGLLVLGLAAVLWLKSPRVTIGGHVALVGISLLGLAMVAASLYASFASWGIVVAELIPEGEGWYKLKIAKPAGEFITKRINRRAILVARSDSLPALRGDSVLWQRVVNRDDIPEFPFVGPSDLARLRSSMQSLFEKLRSEPEGALGLVSAGSTFEVMTALESLNLRTGPDR